MTESELLDELAKAIDSPREKGRLQRIKKAFAEYTAYRKRKWWLALSHGKNKWQFWKREE